MFDDLVKNMDATLFGVFGVRALYDEREQFSAVINRDVLRQTDTGEIITNSYEIVLPKAINPKVGKTIRTDDQTFTVLSIISCDASTVTVSAR